MRKIEFVSYSGSYPNLCSGKLHVRVDGKDHLVNCDMISGGECYWDEGGACWGRAVGVSTSMMTSSPPKSRI